MQNINSDSLADSRKQNAPSSVDLSQVLSTAARVSLLSQPASRETNSHRKSKSMGDKLSKEDMERLSSLPRRSIASLPSECDRKRVLGCLAAIISNMYEYEYISMEHYDMGSFEAPTVTTDSFGDASSSSQSGASYNMLRSESGLLDDNHESITFDDDSKRAHSKQRSLGRKRMISRQSDELDRLEQLEHYRKRRHKVYSEFFLSAGDMLLLDKSVTIAFLPMLDSLLQDESTRKTEYENQSNRILSSIRRTDELSDSSESENIGIRRNKVEKGDGLLRTWKHENDDSLVMRDLRNISVAGVVDHAIFTDVENRLQTWNDNEILRPFVDTLTPGTGFQCLSLLLLNHLLHCGHGYDARIRHVIKKLAVVLISHELKYKEDYDPRSGDDVVIKHATRKFEALEHSVAVKLLMLSSSDHDNMSEQAKGQIVRPERGNITRQSIIRGLKIGSAGVLAGTIFAISGGVAAPGIAAGLAALGTSAVLASTLTSAAAVTIFGVGGGGLAAYKIHRRTQGVTEFEFIKESNRKNQKSQSDDFDAELFSTVCLSGWLRDYKDFQRPWGVTPTHPPITDRAEKLARFYSVYKPENVARVQDILLEWKKQEKQLWEVLKKKYGRDPDHVLPFTDGPRIRASLTHEEDELIVTLLSEIGFKLPQKTRHRIEPFRLWHHSRGENENDFHSIEPGLVSNPEVPSVNRHLIRDSSVASLPTEASSLLADTTQSVSSNDRGQDHERKASQYRVWDYRSQYGGELYTVRWESDLLMELCDSVTEMLVGMLGSAARMVLKQTALHAFMAAIAWPYALISAANIIDSSWTLAIERADAAGIELARSLLETPAGHRPVILVGFSFAARTVYSCLKELARHQTLWQEHNESEDAAVNIRRAKDDRIFKYTREPASIVEDAIMMGMPNHLDISSWEACRLVVAGRLINCYTPNDQILSLMFQFKMVTEVFRAVCGNSPVPVSGVENYDVSSFISSHSDYCLMVEDILQLVRHGQPHVVKK